MVSALTRRPVKITMTDPSMLAKVAFDEHYRDIKKMKFDLGKLLNFNFRLLAAAGCKNIQIDEPLFTISEEDEVEAAVASSGRTLKYRTDDRSAPITSHARR